MTASDTDRHTALPEDALQSWEAVLAAVELDIRRTEALMTTRPAPAGGSSAGAPAETMLPRGQEPAGVASWAVLPAFDQMPPIPPELGERIQTLRAHIVAIQAEMAAAMTEWRATCAAPRRESVAMPVAAAHFVDRRV